MVWEDDVVSGGTTSEGGDKVGGRGLRRKRKRRRGLGKEGVGGMVGRSLRKGLGEGHGEFWGEDKFQQDCNLTTRSWPFCKP